MNAEQLRDMLRFVGGKPMVIPKNYHGGRIQLFRKGQWIGTLVPGSLLGIEQPYALFSLNESGYIEFEERGSLRACVAAINTLQQEDGDWDRASEVFDHIKVIEYEERG